MSSAQQSDDQSAQARQVPLFGFWEIDVTDMTLTLSDETHAIFGRALAPHRLEDLLQFVHPDERTRVYDAFTGALGEGTPLNVECRIIRPSGEARDVCMRGEPIRADEGSTRYVGTIQDITEQMQRRRQAEQNARLLQMASHIAHMGGWTYEVQTGRVIWSDEVCRIHEMPDGTEPTVEEAFNFFVPESRARIRRRFDTCLRDGTPYDEELEIITAGGRKVCVRAIGEPVRDANNTIVQLQGAFLDISEIRDVEQQAARMAERLSATLESITDAFYTLDREWRFTYLNREAERLFQRPRAELLGKVVWDVFSGFKGQREFERAVRENSTVVFENYYAPYHMLFEVRGYPSEDGITVYFRDITEARQTEESLRASEERFRTIARTTTDVVWDWDMQADSLWTSDTIETLFGYTTQEFSGPIRAWSEHIHPDERDRVVNHIKAAIAGGDSEWIDEYRFLRKDGTVAYVLDRGFIIRDATGRATRMIGAMVDLTERRQAERRIEYLAYYDSLTQLPNRQLLMDRLRKAIATSAQHHSTNALFFIDLDNFKSLNDTLGHAVGDQLLKQVAHRLTGCVSHNDTVSRFGGDEYVVLLEHLSDDMVEASAATQAIGERMLKALRQPYKLDEYRHLSTASIGVVLFNGDKDDIGELLKRADMAMYQAKSAGRNTLRFFNPHMQAALSARIALESDLRQAMRDCAREFDLHYQPQVSRDGRVTGVEALLRWRHPTRGMVSPVEFIPLAEETGLVLSLGEWVLKKACQQLLAWAASPETAGLEIAVNVSARQFHHPGFAAQVLAVLGPAGVNPHQIKLELTETSLLENLEDTVAKMSLLKTHGVTFALDDFGTGYSSLAYLKQLPLDMLKIDRSFVLDLLTNPNDAVIARTIIALGRSLGLRVLAEGVETVAQRDFLFEHGCEAYQGFLCAQPMPAAAVAAIVHHA
ncbi:EAL domain-containing protein [Massilia horti]|uniref:EAL domain-containing protein n=1 Tax=Massilia horti TaxID=2562153 RepID=A0A4Y9T7Q7_9BURK|nr:EAL domain-containing protein [Massilia horti]TFW33500.1 EAL domain-containing protein [Massilia horti]